MIRFVKRLITHLSVFLLGLFVLSWADFSYADVNRSSLISTRRDDQLILGVCAPIRLGRSSVAMFSKVRAHSMRLDVPWKVVELQKGEYRIPSWMDDWVDSLLAVGGDPLILLEYGNPIYSIEKPDSDDEILAFSKYASFVVNHFRGRVKLYELWNEWNGSTGGSKPGSVKSYLALAKVVVPLLRRVDPDIRVLSQGVSPGGVRGGWLDSFFAQKGHQLFDGVALHPYPFPWRSGRTPEDVFAMVDSIQDSAKQSNNGVMVPFYLTELGWPSSSDTFGDEDNVVAAYLARSVLLAFCRPYIKGSWWYSLSDNGVNRFDKEDNFGLFDFRGVKKKSANAFISAADVLSKADGRCVVERKGDHFTVRLGTNSNNRDIIVKWTWRDFGPTGNVGVEAVVQQSALELGNEGMAPMYDTDLHWEWVPKYSTELAK